MKKEKLLSLVSFFLPIAAILFVFRKVVFSNAIFSHLDTLINFVPYLSKVPQAAGFVEQGYLSGFPIYVSISATWFNPINQILFRLFDAFDVFRLLDVGYILFAYLFTYLFCRKLHLGHYSSIMAGVVYIFSGQVLLWSETILITFYYALLPLVLYGVEIIFSRQGVERLLWVLLVGSAFGLGWLSGHVQFEVYVYALFGLYFLYKFVQTWPTVGRFSYSVKFSLIFLAVLSLSYVIGFPQIAAVLDFVSVTVRSTGVSTATIYGYSYLPHHLLHYLLPSFRIPYLSLPSAFPNYIGLAPFAIAVIGFFYVKKLWVHASYRFFFSVFIFCLLTSIYKSPLALFLHQLPFFDSFRETVRIMFIGNFAWAISIAYTLELIYRERESLSVVLQKYYLWIRRGFLYVVVPLVVTFTVIKVFFFEKILAFATSYFMTNIFSETKGGLPEEHYLNVLKGLLHQSIDQFTIFQIDIIVLIIFGIGTYVVFVRMRSYTQNQFFATMVFLTAFNFSLLYAYRVPVVSRADYFSVPKTALVIQEHAATVGHDSYRVFPVLNDLALYNESIRCSFPDPGNWNIALPDYLLRKELLEANTNLLYGIESADGYEPFITERMSNLIGSIGSRFTMNDVTSLSGEVPSVQEKLQKIIERKNIYRMMNVRYVISHFEILDSDFIEIYREQFGDCGTTIVVYELADTWPRYFLTAQPAYVAPASLSFLEYRTLLTSLSEPAFILETNEVATLSPRRLDIPHTAVVPHVAPDRLVFALDADEEQYLVIGNQWLPNWRATIDGVSVPLLRANYVYMAVAVPAGNHEVVLTYEKPRTRKDLFSPLINSL